MDLRLTTVRNALLRLSAHYPEAGQNGATIKPLAEDYLDDMLSEHVTEDQFLEGIKIARKRCHFFPKISDILDAVNEYRARPQAANLQVKLIAEESYEADMTEEEAARNRKLINLSVMAASGHITVDEAIKRQKKIINDGGVTSFSGRLEA